MTEEREIVLKYQNGATIQELAEEYRHCKKTISKVLHNAGIVTKEKHKSTCNQRIQIYNLFKDGHNIDEIAVIMEMDRAEAARILQNAVDLYEPDRFLKRAEEKQPQIKKVVIRGKRYEDLSEFWGL